MDAAMLPLEVMELVAEHIGLDDTEELSVESSDQTVGEIEAGWNECSRDMTHLPRAEKQDVLQRIKPYRPRMIECDGDTFAVTLYNDVQVMEGKPRTTAAIVDFADRRFVAVGC